MKTNTTTASQLLNLVFEGHSIRSVIENGQPLFNAKDAAAACGISSPRDIVKTHVDPDQLVSISLDTRSATGVVQKRAVNFLTQSGVFALVMGSRKPAARRFSRWLMDEVIPQLIKYGSYIPGASPAERLKALSTRYRAERAERLAADGATLAEGGLMTLRAFRLEHALPARDILPIASRLRRLAQADGITPLKLTLPGYSNPTNAWPRPLLAAVVNSTQPRLF